MNVLWWFSPLFPATLPLSVCILCVATFYEEEVGEAAAFCVCPKKNFPVYHAWLSRKGRLLWSRPCLLGGLHCRVNHLQS